MFDEVGGTCGSALTGALSLCTDGGGGGGRAGAIPCDSTLGGAGGAIGLDT